MTHGSLFSGIGGFDLAAEWMGWDNVFHCELNPFCQKVLKHHFPKAKSYDDITKSDFTIHRGRVDVLTGGFPCQPFSQAGKRLGTDDSRYLWKEMLRVIREVRPKWIVGENVYGLINWNGGLVFSTICSDLENEGYSVIPIVLPAASQNAPHNRARIFFIAYSNYTSTKYSISARWDLSSSEIGSRSFTNSNDNGCREHDNEHEIISDFGRLNAFNDADQVLGQRITTNTESERSWKQQSEDRGWEDRRFNNDGKVWDASNSEQQRLQRPDINGEASGEERALGGERSEPSDISSTNDSQSSGERNASDTNSEMLQGWNEQGETGRRTEQEERTKSFYFTGKWEEFPTISPICTGDDGISYRLDSITFSKWRNESIKAAGNAVVPQVILPIFKTIQQIENERISTANKD